MNEAIIEKLFLRYQQKGFLTNDDILTELISSNVSIVQTERICSELLAKGVLVSDEKTPAITENQSQKFIYDKAHINYDGLYDKIIKKEPNLEFLVNYIRKIQPPQLHEVERLYPQIQTGNKFARKRLFEMSMRQALKIAYQKAKEFNLSLEDTAQDALIGLWLSIEKFDLSRHDKFQGYSTFWILNSINRNKNISEALIVIPIHFQEFHEKIYKYLKECHTDFFDSCDFSQSLIREIAMNFDISTESCHKHLQLLSPIFNYDELEIIAETDISEKICDTIFSERVNSSLDELKPRERQVLKFRFGLYKESDYDYNETVNMVTERIYKNEGKYAYSLTLTLEEIAKLYGLTRERIRQIESKGLKNLATSKTLKMLWKIF